MTLLDWAMLVVWLGIALSGFWKGAVRIVFGLGGVAAGLWLAVVAGAELELVLDEVIGISWIDASLARLLPILACLLLCLVAGWGIEKTLEALHLRWLNRLAGAVLAGAVGLVLLAILVGTAARLSPEWERWSAGSVLTPRLEALWEMAAVPSHDPGDPRED
jgi:uncharacterized membrane protein required for colicin V production